MIIILFKVIGECKKLRRKEALFGYVVGDMLNYKADAKKVVKVSLWKYYYNQWSLNDSRLLYTIPEIGALIILAHPTQSSFDSTRYKKYGKCKKKYIYI